MNDARIENGKRTVTVFTSCSSLLTSFSASAPSYKTQSTAFVSLWAMAGIVKPRRRRETYPVERVVLGPLDVDELLLELEQLVLNRADVGICDHAHARAEG